MLSQPPLNDLAVPEYASIWSWIFENAQFNPAENGFVGYTDASAHQQISFAQVKEYSTNISSVLHDQYDVKPGDKISILCYNSIWYPVVLFAGLRLGAIVATNSPELTPNELKHVLLVVRPKLVITESMSDSLLLTLGSLTIRQPAVLVVDGQSPGSQSLEELLARDTRKRRNLLPWNIPTGESNKIYCALLCFSSGTTGLPKAVMISHNNVIAQLCQVRACSPPVPHRVVLGVLPFYHITGVIHLLHLPLVLGQEIIVMPRFFMESMLQAIAAFRCEELWMVPPLLIRLVSETNIKPHEFSSVRQFNTGAAPLGPSVIKELKKKFPKVAIRQAWGMTESCSCLTITLPEDQVYENANTVGKPVPGTTLRIVEPGTDKAVYPGTSGEILAKGPQVTMGYLDDVCETQKTYSSDGYLRTGDIGFIDQKGFVHIVDRIKEIIKVKGVGVAPAELEGVLLGHEAISDAAVAAISHHQYGQLPKAYIVLKENILPSIATAMSIQNFVRQRLSRPKWIRGGVAFVDKIPKSAAGKILRRKLPSLKAQLETGDDESRAHL